MCLLVIEHPDIGNVRVTEHAMERFTDAMIAAKSYTRPTNPKKLGPNREETLMLKLLTSTFHVSTEHERRNKVIQLIRHDDPARYFITKKRGVIFVISEEPIVYKDHEYITLITAYHKHISEINYVYREIA